MCASAGLQIRKMMLRSEGLLVGKLEQRGGVDRATQWLVGPCRDASLAVKMALFLERVAWGFLEILPIALARLVLVARFGKGYMQKAKEHGRARLAARLRVAAILRLRNDAAWRGVVLIGGVARVGKSTVAKMVVDSIGGNIVEFDRLRHYYRDGEVGGIELKYLIIDELCRKGRGLILEGDELVTDERVDLSREVKRFSVNANLIRRMMDTWGVHGFCLGASEDSPERKEQGLRDSAEMQKCWAVSKLPGRDLGLLSAVIVEESKALREAAQGLGVPYLEIESARFEESSRDAASQISGVLRSRETVCGGSKN